MEGFYSIVNSVSQHALALKGTWEVLALSSASTCGHCAALVNICEVHCKLVYGTKTWFMKLHWFLLLVQFMKL